MRKYYSVILSIVLLAGAIYIFKLANASKVKQKPPAEKIIASVYIDTVQNKNIPIIISATGSVTAKHKVELFSEVQGILKPSKKDFKSGTNYTKGELLLSIADDEFLASLQAQRSSLFNAITAILPDIRLDFPNEYPKWQAYLNSFNIQHTTPKLPETSSEKEKLFISGKSIYTNYYQVKNAEVRLSKYQIKAPFSGILTESLVNSGTLIRVGQKLGEFIDPTVYEMQLAINASYASYLTIGKTVELEALEGSATYSGTVVRVNGKVDQATQTINVFIEIKDTSIKDGMYLEAKLNAKNETDALEISRKLLQNERQIYAVKDSTLQLIDVIPVFFNKETVVIKGVENGTLILTKSVPGSYAGMKVKPLSN